MIEKREIIVLISRKKYSPRSFYFHRKTTACFTKNNGSFYRKQRLVLLKTTARFTKNDRLFYQKRRVVSIRRKASAETFTVISSRAQHPILLLYKPSQGKNCANTTNLRRNKSHNTKQNTNFAKSIEGILGGVSLMRTSTMQQHIRHTSYRFIPLSSSTVWQLPSLLLSHNLPNYANTLSSLSTY